MLYDTSETEENIKIATMKAIANAVSEFKIDFTDENNFLKKLLKKVQKIWILTMQKRKQFKDKSVGLYECVKYIKDFI